jgi:hypothetical protein
MRVVKTLAIGIILAAATPGLHAQGTTAGATGKTPAAPSAKPAAQPAKPAAQTAKPSSSPTKPPATSSAGQTKPAAPVTKTATPSTAAKTPAQTTKAPATSPKPAPKQAVKKSGPKSPKSAASAGNSTAASDKDVRVAKRDPFESLVGHEQGAVGKTGPLPPGKAGLQVSTLRLDGIVRAPNGMIAVVSNPQLRTYFLREGDQLYDGRVEKIAMDGVSFHEVGKDAFGKPVERQVNKRIYASAGEQQ